MIHEITTDEIREMHKREGCNPNGEGYNKVWAVKEIRSRYNSGIREAKDFVESVMYIHACEGETHNFRVVKGTTTLQDLMVALSHVADITEELRKKGVI